MTKINLNQSPYFDDFNESKKFYKILFRPGRAVQARELNQIQSTIQKQIERFGSHIFENGAQVSPGNTEGVKYTPNIGFIKIPRTAFADDENQIENYWLGKDIISTSIANNIKATVIGYRTADSIDEVRLYVNYLNASDPTITNETHTEFSAGQNIETVETTPITAQIVSRDSAVGFISSVRIPQSIYFFNGNFILVDEQQVFLIPENTEDQDAWNNNPTATVGLNVVESLVTADDDETLLDNALGSPNYSAPGADRLHISSTLVQLNSLVGQKLPENFILLLEVVEGEVRSKTLGTDYSILEDTLARRTYDESGDYTVNPFGIQIKDFLRTDTNDGVHRESEYHFDNQQDAEDASVSIFGLQTPSAVSHPNFPGRWIPGTSYDGISDATSFLQLCDNRISIKIDPGKAYVKGYELQKLSTTIVDIEKARTLKYRNNRTIATPLGTFFYVTKMFGAVSVENYDTVELHSKIISTSGISPASKIGTARVLAVEYFSGTVGSEDAIYRLFLFNIQIDGGKDISQVKSLFSTSPTFTCDVQREKFRLIGSVAKGAANVLIGTGTSWKNDQSQRIREGDYVQVGLGASSSIYRVTSDPISDNELSVSPDPTSDGSTWTVGSTIDILYTLSQSDSDNTGLLFRLPDSFVYSVRGGEQGTVDSSAIDTVYTSRRVLGTNVVPTSDELQFNLSDPNEEFEDFNTSSYVLIKVSGTGAGDWFELLPYSSGTPAAGKAEVQTLGNQLTIYLNSSDCGVGSEFYVISSIIHSGSFASKERSKTLVKGTFVGGVYSGPHVETLDATTSIINLEKADILRITRVVESPDSATVPSNLETLPAGHTDVTALYILDNGQRDYFYDLGKVTLRKGFTRPRGRIRVEFDYFEHGTTGNYFSVDSYPTKGPGKQMEYHEIPEFVSSDGTSYELSSSIDFRPRVNSGGVDSGFSTSLELPKQNFRCDYHFYEGRIDKLYLDKTGLFLVKHGIPDVNPKAPEDPDTGMTIYQLNFTPYTTDSYGVFPVMKDNRRYTMRDIGKIEQRVKNLEYYTSLSLLEKDTSSLEIKDAEGNDKFKNGFLVDNFGTFGSSDLSTQDFRASLDRQTQTCRPIIFQDNVALFEKVLLENNEITRDNLRSLARYQKTGQIFTLPYTNVVMVEQVKASNVANVNPYSVFTFSGAITLTPWSDEWRDVVTAEPLNVLDQSAYDAARQNFGPDGTQIDYTSTQNNWTGKDVTRELVGQVLEVAGHDIWDKLPLKKQEKIRKQGFMVVPEGYVNAGQKVPVGITSMVAPRRAITTTLTGKEITTQFISTLQDGGFSTPISLGSRIIDTALAEFIRSREVKFLAKGFMPNARLYAFFDEVDVNEDCKPDGGSYGSPLICDSRGKLSGTFKIPNKEGKKFKTGDREFRLTTSPNNTKNPAPASAGDVRYTARGWIDTSQETFLSTRLFNIAKSQHTFEEDINLTVGTVFKTGKAAPRDPIAQSFFVYDDGGCYITAVDIFFRRRPTGDFQPPITLEVRPLSAGGNPSNIILPFSQVLLDADQITTNDINLTTGQIIINGPSVNLTEDLGSDPAGQMQPTRFTFDSPIYLSQNESYCIVLISDSNQYETWIAQSGPASSVKLADTTFVPVTDEEPTPTNVEIGTDKEILSDPYIQGVFFKSQNGISWTADQTVDMKFKIWKAEFNTAVSGEIEFVNEELPLKELTLDPFETKNGSSKIRVMHPQHCNNSSVSKSRVVFSPSYDRLLTGTLSSIGPNVTGVGTLFTTELVVGSFIQHPVTREQKKVISISSDTSLIVDSSFVSSPLSTTAGVFATSYSVVDGVALNGISAENIFNFEGFEIELAEMDFYIIDVGVNATVSGRVGGVGIHATENKRFEELTLLTTPLELPETSITWNIETTQSAGINDYTSQPFKVMPRVNIVPNDKILFDNPMLVSSYINELNSGDTPAGPSQVGTSGLGDKKSLKIKAVLKSSNKNLSPIIDTSRFSVALISNRIDNPRGSIIDADNQEQVTNNIFDDYQCLPTTEAPTVVSTANLIWFSDDTDSNTTTSIKTADDSVAKHLSKLDIGKLVSISGATGNRNVTDGMIIDVNYTPENIINDSDLAAPKKAEIKIKYTTTVAASLEANNFTITQKDRFIDEIAPQGGSCSAKYTCKKLTLSRPSNSLRVMFDAYRDESCVLDLYYKLEPVNSAKDVDQIIWEKATYNLDINGVLTDITPKANRNSFELSAYECTLNNLPSFVGVQAKIVMRGGNPARVPLIKNFRLIALDE